MHAAPTTIKTTSVATMALAVTVILFAVMQALIATTQIPLEEIPYITIDLVKPMELEPVRTIDKQPTKPPEPDVPPTLPPVTIEGTGFTVTLAPELDPPMIESTGPVMTGSDGPYLPIVRVEPAYPRQALSRGIEGYAIVEFDVWTDGSVRHARVVEHDPGPIFDRAALAAIARFRFKPMIDGGTPVVVSGVQNRFTFELEKSP